MKRRNFLQALAFSSALATGIVSAGTLPPINKLRLPTVTLPNGAVQTQVIVGEECLFKSLDEVRQWMRTNSWEELKIIVNTDGVNYTFQDCMSLLPANSINSKISLLMQLYENPRLKGI